MSQNKGNEKNKSIDSGQADPRNRLNDLTNKEWMISTKSVWESQTEIPTGHPFDFDNWSLFIEWLQETKGESFVEEAFGQILPSVMNSHPPARDKLKSQHPATFAESDVERLITFFTKQGQKVLDPFVGSGSTLIACRTTKRCGVGIELVSEWVEIARQRVSGDELPLFKDLEIVDQFPQELLEGDAREKLKTFEEGTFDFIVTSPPYWKILHKDNDHKVTKERVNKGLDTKYSDLEDDLGNIRTYEKFLGELQKVFYECYRVLKKGKYMCVIVSDFRDKDKFITYHSDISAAIEECGFRIKGITILVQDNKNLYPYGVPYAFVSNINHQYILVFQKR